MKEYQKASLSKRFIASAIDYLVIGCFFMVFVYTFGELDENGEYVVHGLQALVPIGFWFLYLIVIETLVQATLGHFIIGLKVIRDDTSRITFTNAFKRHLLDPIDFFFFGVPAIITIKSTPSNKRLGDIWAKTLVIKDMN